jgi:hypothetical protein
MTGLGQNRKSAFVIARSALPPISDIASPTSQISRNLQDPVIDVPLSPIAAISRNDEGHHYGQFRTSAPAHLRPHLPRVEISHEAELDPASSSAWPAAGSFGT